MLAFNCVNKIFFAMLRNMYFVLLQFAMGD